MLMKAILFFVGLISASPIRFNLDNEEYIKDIKNFDSRFDPNHLNKWIDWNDKKGHYDIGVSILHLAVLKGREDIVYKALMVGCKVDVKGVDKMTPLFYASSFGQLQIATLLLDHGANSNARTYSIGETPLFQVSRNGDVDMARVLLSYGANVNSLQRYCKTPLDVAKKEEMITFLKSSGGVPGYC